MRAILTLAVVGVLAVWAAGYQREIVQDLWGRINDALVLANHGR